MAKRRSTPYPRHRRNEQLVKFKVEDEEDDENLIKYHRQSNVVKPIPRRGREVFAKILNKEWELRGGNVFLASIETQTVNEDSQTDHGSNGIWESPSPNHLSPPPLARPATASSSRSNGEGEPPGGSPCMFGLSAEDARLVARYLTNTPVAAVPRVQAATGPINTITTGTEYDHFLEAVAGHGTVPNLETLVHKEVDMEEPGLMEPIVPLDIDIVFRYDGVVLHMEFLDA